jgi:2-dehydropantoate 2-reductase
MANKDYTIGIVGGGAVGLTYAALLSEAANIIIKTRGSEQATLINDQGLTIVKRDEKPINFGGIKASGAYSSLAQCDAIIIAIKSYDTEEVAKGLNKVIRPEAAVLTLQNGLQAFDVLQERLDNPERVFAGVTYMYASRDDGRRVVSGDYPRVIVDEKIGFLVDMLRHCRFQVEAAANSKQAVWDKLAVNVGQNALSAVTNLNFSQMLASEDCLTIAGNLLAEVRRIGEAEGVIIDNFSVDRLRDLWEGSDFFPSMWQDIHKGRRTEIDAINGSISKLGRKYGIATPYNDMITSLAKVLESAV